MGYFDTMNARHIGSATGPTGPRISFSVTGAGTGASAQVIGTDTSGEITLTTAVADTPVANADILTVNFGATYAIAPKVMISPSNDAAWGLTFAAARYRQSDTDTSKFKIRSGSQPLPATTSAIYKWLYHVIG